LIRDAHLDQIRYLTELRATDPRQTLPVLVGFTGPPFHLLVNCADIHDSFRVVEVFTRELTPLALTLGANSFYFRSPDDSEVTAVQTGELARRFHDGDPTVLECIQIFTTISGGANFIDSIPYDTRSGETVWYEQTVYEGVALGGVVSDRLRLALIDAGAPAETRDPVHWLAAAQALNEKGYVVRLKRGDPH